ncbi:MAG TPA: hypothetical protein P5267_02815, partial [Patescibacteria group bacterium]|nr:hypothetical protein [Patescibacteria group bacterium]
MDSLLPVALLKILLIPLILIAVLALGLLAIRKILRHGTSLPHAFTKAILRISLPKEVNLEDSHKEVTKEQI